MGLLQGLKGCWVNHCPLCGLDPSSLAALPPVPAVLGAHTGRRSNGVLGPGPWPLPLTRALASLAPPVASASASLGDLAPGCQGEIDLHAGCPCWLLGGQGQGPQHGDMGERGTRLTWLGPCWELWVPMHFHPLQNCPRVQPP